MTNTIPIRLLTPADIPAALRLSQQNGWNQQEADWRRFLHMQPDGCFAAESEGTVVGTACGCIFGQVAWVALVLVEASYRKRGIGTALMRRVLAFLDERQVPTIRLDATPLGRPIYEKLGFVAEYELVRYAGIAKGAGALSAQHSEMPNKMSAQHSEPARAEDLPEICRLNESITQTDRRKFLERLFAKNPEAVHVVRGENGLLGYAASRPGARAVQIGPCLADAVAGPLLLAEAFQRHAGQNVYIDIPLSHTLSINLAQENGLTVQRHLLRMCRGPRVAEDVTCLWASSGPEKG